MSTTKDNKVNKAKIMGDNTLVDAHKSDFYVICGFVGKPSGIVSLYSWSWKCQKKLLNLMPSNTLPKN